MKDYKERVFERIVEWFELENILCNADFNDICDEELKKEGLKRLKSDER